MSEATLSANDAAAIQSEWLRRTAAEYRSAAVTHHLTLWLLQLTAPLELVRSGLRIVEDEVTHSELSHRVYRAAGGTQAVDLKAESIGLTQPSFDRMLEALVSVTVETFCLGETVAVRLFSRLRASCTQADARMALDRILKDEVRHKEFGWTLLEWLLSTAKGPEAKAIATRVLGPAFARLRGNYAHHTLGQDPQRSAALAAWGLMPPPDYAAALEETLTRDYVPLFGDFEIDALQAWQLGPV